MRKKVMRLMARAGIVAIYLAITVLAIWNWISVSSEGASSTLMSHSMFAAILWLIMPVFLLSLELPTKNDDAEKPTDNAEVAKNIES